MGILEVQSDKRRKAGVRNPRFSRLFESYQTSRHRHLSAITAKIAAVWSRMRFNGMSELSDLPEGDCLEDGCDSANWGDWKWHIANRLSLRSSSSIDDLREIAKILQLSGDEEKSLRKAVLEGIAEETFTGPVRRHFDFSLLPLNTMLPPKVRQYFLPQPDYGRSSKTKQRDPYGLVWARSEAASNEGDPTSGVFVSDEGRRFLIGTQKFPHTLLLNIDMYCPIGCADCYKSRLGTREDTFLDGPAVGKVDAPIYNDSKTGPVVPQSKQSKSDIVDRVVTWLQSTDRGAQVYDVILSGGEPLILSDSVLEAALRKIAMAPQIQTIRICTGALFMGLAPRITDNLADLLARVSSDTGVKLSIHSHIVSKHQITPEATNAVLKLRRAGISIYSQTPIKHPINFDLDDIPSTVAEFAEMYRTLVTCGVEPYMMIADMHPTTINQYVPIEQMLAMWGRLVESHTYPGTERPRTLSVLHEGGNIIISGPSLFAARKTVDHGNGIVVYEFPQVGSSPSGKLQVDKWQRYEEPLLPGNCEPESLAKLRASIGQEETAH